MLTIQQIIDEVDTFVPNSFDNTKKITWINEINREFFEIVKIPVIHSVSFTVGATVILPTDVRSRNIVRVQVGNTFYLSLQYEKVNPGHNYWVVNDTTKAITLNPTVSATTPGNVTYNKVSTKTYLVSTIATDQPEAPEEYHWVYVLGLAERVAKAMNDVTLANNFGSDYRGQLMIAQQNFSTRQKEG